MDSSTIASISAGCIFGGVLLGMLLQKVLPQRDLGSDSKDTVKVGAGMLATLCSRCCLSARCLSPPRSFWFWKWTAL